MDIFTEAELAEFRADAASLMRDTCRITRPGAGQGPFNPSTGQYDDPPPVTVYEGKCRIPSPNGPASTSRNGAADQSFTVGEFPLDLPVEGDGYVAGESVAAGQTVTYLTAADNPALPGMVFGIVAPALSSSPTKARWRIKTNVAQ